MLAVAVLGLVVYLLVFRPLREAPTLAKVVAGGLPAIVVYVAV